MRKVTYPISSNVITELRQVESEIAGLLGHAPAGVREASRLIFQAGGKRLRPALVILCSMAGKYDRETATPAAIAVELVHMASLVHDDILDGAETRRGAPTAAVAFGRQTAARVGDFLFGLAFDTAARSESPEIIAPLSIACMDLSNGELLQLETAHKADQSMTTYMNKISCKTASLFRASCAMGAIVGGSSPKVTELLADFGWHIGMAFQIYDDVLDIAGDKMALGKPVGTDLLEGTLTLPMIRAMENESVGALVRKAICGQLRGQGWVDKVIKAIKSTDCVERAKEEARQFTLKARQSAILLPDGLVRSNLLSLGEFVVNRYH